MSPVEIRHPLFFERREVTAGVTGHAPISCSPLPSGYSYSGKPKEGTAVG